MTRTLRRASATLRKRDRTAASIATSATAPPSLPEEQPIVLRLPMPLLSQVDKVVKARPIRTPRHTWLLEAILEKLEREQA